VVGISQGRVAQIINNANSCEINNLLTQGRDMEYIQTNPYIFLENELQDDSVCAIFAPTAEDFSVVQIEGKRDVSLNVICYSLEVATHQQGRYNEKNLPDKQSNFLLYNGNDGKVNTEVFLKDETVWLTQKAIGELFGVNIPAISKHLANIFESEELQKEATLSILETVQMEGSRQVKRKMEFYTLDAIISVGYSVNSCQATQFRIWATRS